MSLEDPLQEEQDPEELPQAETLNNLAPNLAEAIMLMTKQLCHRDAVIGTLGDRSHDGWIRLDRFSPYVDIHR